MRYFLAYEPDKERAVELVRKRVPVNKGEEAEAVAVARLAASKRRAQRVVALAAGAHDELPHAPGGVDPAVGVERGEALVVLVSHQHDVGAGLVQRQPQSAHGRVAAVDGAGTESAPSNQVTVTVP